MIAGSVAKISFMPEIGFECHDLGDGHTLWTGDLPAKLRYGPAAFKVLQTCTLIAGFISL